MDCDGLEEGKRTLYWPETCGCKAKYIVTRRDDIPFIRHLCGRNVLTFKSAVKKGMKYKIKEI